MVEENVEIVEISSEEIVEISDEENVEISDENRVIDDAKKVAKQTAFDAGEAVREAKEAVAEHQKELLRGAPSEILKQKKVASQLAKKHATTTAEVQKMAELAAEQAVANVKRKEEKIKKAKKSISKAFSTKKKKKYKK
jgi:hypothetical protein